MKTPSFSSLQDGKDKIIYPCISNNTRMMDVLAEVQEQEAQAAHRKREKLQRRLLIGLVFIITSLIMAIFIASMATYVLLNHTNWYRGSSSPKALALTLNGKDMRVSVRRLPLSAKSFDVNSKVESRVIVDMSNKTKESKSVSPSPSPSTSPTPVTTSPPPSIKLTNESSQDKSLDVEEMVEDSTELLEVLSTPSSIIKHREQLKVEKESTHESNKVISVTASTTVAPKRAKSSRIASTTHPSSSSLFRLSSTSGLGYKSPYVESTLTLAPATRSSATIAPTASLVPSVTSWSLQMMTSARRWLENRGFLGA